MQMQDSDLKQKGRHSRKIIPYLEFISCIICGNEIELWSAEDETICLACGHKVFKKETIIH